MNKVLMYWGLLLLINMTAVGMFFGITQSFLLAAIIGAALVAFWFVKRQEKRKCRQLYPKDYAYYLYIVSKSRSAMTKLDLILNEFPQMNEAEVKAWIKEFEEVDLYKGRISAAGGIWVLGTEKVRELLVGRFPFLTMLGLRCAIAHAAFYARREGYHKSPKLKAEEI